MDSRLEKALSFSNYQKTLNVKKQVLKEKKDARSTFAFSGGIFKSDLALISFVQLCIDQNRSENIPFLDANENPILIVDLQIFRDELLANYFESTMEFYKEYEKIKKSRSIETIIDL